MPAFSDERNLPLPKDLDASEEEQSSTPSCNLAELEEHCRRMANPPKRQLSGPDLSPQARKKKKKKSNLPTCMMSDSDFDDEALIAACKALNAD